MNEITLQPTDEWGRPRCQLIGTYVDADEDFQCALVENHAGNCDPLPVYPDAEPTAEFTGTFTRAEITELLDAVDRRITDLEQRANQSPPADRRELFAEWLGNARSAKGKLRAMRLVGA